MKLDITIKYHDSCDCLENLILAIAKWMKKDYELMFTEAWGFSYKPIRTCDGEIIGENIDVHTYRKDKWNSLYKYHGIGVKEKESRDYSMGLSIIKNQLSANMPVVIHMDTFWCHWRKELYQKFHRSHYCLVTNIDDRNNNLFVFDAQIANKGVILPIDDFIKGFRGYITFENKDIGIGSVDWKEIIENSTYRLKNTDESINLFEDMRILANDIKYKLVFENEVKNFEEFPFKAQIFQKIFDIGRGCKQYSTALKYINKLYNIQELDILSNRMNFAGNRWFSIFGMLCKSYYMNHNDLIIDRVVAKIKEAANDEEDIADNLVKLCKYGSLTSVDTLHKETKKHIDSKINKIFYLDLSQYFNNQGFSSSLSLDCSAELSNGGRYFLNENLPDERIWSINNMKFKFPILAENTNDNISCMGQNIHVRQIRGKNIMVLGCSELGNHSEYMNIRYTDGHVEKVPLEFTSWLSSNKSFGEIIAWTGKGAERTKDTVQVYPFPVHIYAKNYLLQYDGIVSSIELPVCPNIHIFAISLGE